EGGAGGLDGGVELGEAGAPGGLLVGGGVVGGGRGGRVGAAEEGGFMLRQFRGDARGVEVVGRGEGAVGWDGDAAVLGLLLGEAFARQREVRTPEDGVVLAFGDGDRGGGDALDPGA